MAGAMQQYYFLMNSVGILEEDLWLYLGYYFQGVESLCIS